MNYYKVNKKYKDRVFRIVFEEKADLLQLYNAVNNSDYTNPDDLQITTMDDVVYMGMKNDVSFMIGDVLNLYEHQSSFSPNLPLRGVFYFSSLYREYIEPIKARLYADTPLTIPFPRYIVFYNGTKEEPERQELKLSDLFVKIGKESVPSLECTALMLNINLGYNRELMEKCKKLKEYAEFIALIRTNGTMGISFEEAVERAVEECISRGILSDILRKNRAEVVDMIMTEWNEEEFRDLLREEAMRTGREEGRKEGLEEGLKEGIIEATINMALKFNLSDQEIITNLMEEVPLTEKEAEECLEKYRKEKRTLHRN